MTTPQDAPLYPEDSTSSKRLTLAAILLAAMLASLFANFLNDENFTNTGIYFVVIPGLIAIILSLLPFFPTQTGFGVFRATMIAIFASAIVVREGFICVLLASPLIALVVGLITYASRQSRKNRTSAVLALPMLLLLGAAEGTLYEFASTITVEETRQLDISSEDLVASLAEPAVLPEIEPLLFALPFPEPTSFEGSGLELGSTRRIDFSDGGAIDLEISSVTETSVTWTFVETTTSLDEWMTIHHATASWTENSNGVELTIEIEFDRELAPAFYFDPVQRWGVGELAEVLADMIEHNTLDRTAATNA